MPIYELKINHNLCTGCNICVVSCPINFDQLKKEGQLTKDNAVILVKNGTARAIYKEERKINCDGCGVCIEACPQKVIKMEISKID
ncbi:MAG: 4Fe-4S binding protein [Candidatus Lokiarchaeota archaeon]|nr:4Fe-4S binding protein [Candidatus Lokiarchaeota archaeon]